MHHANDGAGMVTGHGAIGGMGLAVHPSPRHILVVGFGAPIIDTLLLSEKVALRTQCA